MTYSELLERAFIGIKCQAYGCVYCEDCPYCEDTCYEDIAKDKEKLRLIMHKLDEAIEEVAE